MLRPCAIVFDMDGVLADTEPLHSEATRRLLAAHGVEFRPSPSDNFFGLTDEEVFALLRRRYALAPDEASLSREWVAHVISALPGAVLPLPGVPDVLDWLERAGYRLALASGSSPEIIGATLSELGIAARFPVVVSAKQVGRGKPAPDVFLEAARRLDVPPEGCLVIEDSRNGLLAARAAGMSCVAIPCGATRRQDFGEAAACLSRLSDLPAWLGD